MKRLWGKKDKIRRNEEEDDESHDTGPTKKARPRLFLPGSGSVSSCPSRPPFARLVVCLLYASSRHDPFFITCSHLK